MHACAAYAYVLALRSRVSRLPGYDFPTVVLQLFGGRHSLLDHNSVSMADADAKHDLKARIEVLV